MDEAATIDLARLWRWYVDACNWICSCGCWSAECCDCCSYLGDTISNPDEQRTATVAERFERVQFGGASR